MGLRGQLPPREAVWRVIVGEQLRLLESPNSFNLTQQKTYLKKSEITKANDATCSKFWQTASRAGL